MPRTWESSAMRCDSALPIKNTLDRGRSLRAIKGVPLKGIPRGSQGVLKVVPGVLTWFSAVFQVCHTFSRVFQEYSTGSPGRSKNTPHVPKVPKGFTRAAQGFPLCSRGRPTGYQCASQGLSKDSSRHRGFSKGSQGCSEGFTRALKGFSKGLP